LKFPTFDQVPEFLLKHFIRGYIDGDGSLNWRDKVLQTDLCGTENFLNGVNDYFVNNLNIKSGTIRKTSNIHRLHYYSTSTNLAILYHIYNDAKVYLDRKYAKAKEFLQGV
jgi:hypothetical protein